MAEAPDLVRARIIQRLLLLFDPSLLERFTHQIPRPTSWIDTIDITNEYLLSQPRNISEAYKLSFNQHITIGTYLVASGFWVGITNFIGILIYATNPGALLTPSAIPEVSMFLADLGVGGIHPFSGSAALANRWLWGPIGCQLYGLAGFVFGNYQILCCNFIALDRYITVCRPKWGLRFRTWKNYSRLFVLILGVAVGFACLPLAGFAEYLMLPPKHVCTISYMNPNPNFSAYITASLIVLFAIPLPIGLAATLACRRRLGQKDPPKIHFASQRGYGKVLFAGLLVTPICFSDFGVVCIWAWLGSPWDIPKWLIPTPPLIAKAAGIINPFIFIYAHPLHWACARKLLGLKHDASIIQEAEEDNEREQAAREERKKRIRELEEQQEMVSRPSGRKNRD